MPIQLCKINVDNKRRELEVRGTPMFPCGVYLSDVSKLDIIWHWHEEVEVLIVSKGTVSVSLNGTNFILKEGDGAFINSNVLHSVHIAGENGGVLKSFVFDTKLISGAPESIFEQRYVRPILNCEKIKGHLFQKEVTWEREALDCISNAYDAYSLEEYGFEFVVRDYLSKLWYQLIRNIPINLSENNEKVDKDTERIKVMISYIHDNFMQQIELKSIAEVANVSERECLRCFKKTIGISPVQYILKYRISVSARLLLDTDLPITEICKQSGFDNTSYYAKTFKRYMQCSPSDYRKNSM